MKQNIITIIEEKEKEIEQLNKQIDSNYSKMSELRGEINKLEVENLESECEKLKDAYIKQEYIDGVRHYYKGKEAYVEEGQIMLLCNVIGCADDCSLIMLAIDDVIEDISTVPYNIVTMEDVLKDADGKIPDDLINRFLNE